MSPFFSVIIPVYNRAKRLPYVLQSLKEQTFQDFEVIVVDDCSTDNSLEVAQQFDMPNMRVLHNEQNRERCYTRNRGIEEARGKYICSLDSDDYHLPNHFERLHAFIMEKKQPMAFFFTNAYDETEDGIRTQRVCPDFEDFSPYTYFLRYTVNPQRWAVHSDILQQIRFDENVVIAEDMDVSLRIVVAGYPVFQLKEANTVYVAASDSFTHGDKDKAAKELLYYNRIFARPELKEKLKRKETNRLLSKCYFHLARKSFEEGKAMETWCNAWRSFWRYPKGYNGKTNKILLTSCIYSLPVLGGVIKRIHQRNKYAK